MVVNTGLESLCTIADSPEEMKNALNNIMNLSTFSDTGKRVEVLENNFSNKGNANKLKRLLFPGIQD